MCSPCDVGTLEVRGEASGHKARQTSMKMEQVLATLDLPVTEDTTLHDLSQREKATQGDCSTYRIREEEEWLELPLHQKIEEERRTLEEAEGRERARLPMRSRQDSEATVDKRSPHQRLMQAAIMAIRWQNLGNKSRERLQDSEDDMVDMNEEEAETEWERCSPCPLCGMACSVDHDNGVDERKCSHSITQPMGIHEWTRERPACSKTKTEVAEDTSLSATSSQALPIEDAAPPGYAKWIEDQTVDSVAMLGAFHHYRKRHAQVSLEHLEGIEHRGPAFLDGRGEADG